MTKPKNEHGELETGAGAFERMNRLAAERVDAMTDSDRAHLAAVARRVLGVPFTLPDAPGLPAPELAPGEMFIGNADDLRRVMAAAYRAAAGWSEDSPPFVKADVSPPRLPDRLPDPSPRRPACPPDASEGSQTPADPSEMPEALTGATAGAGERVTRWMLLGESAQSSLWPHPDAAPVTTTAPRSMLQLAYAFPIVDISGPICDACGDDPTEWPCVNCHRGIGG